MKTLLELLDFEGVMEAFESPALIAGLAAGAVLSLLHSPAARPVVHAMHPHLDAIVALIQRACG